MKDREQRRPDLAPVVAVGMLALALRGCASPAADAYSFAEGWRKAKVVRVVHGAGIESPDTWSCARDVPAAQRDRRSYLLLDFHEVHRHRQRMVPMPAAATFAPGEQVYLNVERCEGAIARRNMEG